MKEKAKYRGDWKFTLVDNETGEILSIDEIKNTIIDDGLERLARLINGNNTTYFRAIAIGTDNTAVQDTDTALGSEYDRELATLTYVADNKAKFTYTFTFASGVSETIYEAGIFDSTTFTGSTMLARVVTSAKTINSDISLIVEAEITVARV